METDQARVAPGAGRGSTQNLAFFSVVAAAQLVWGVVSMAEAPRWWLALGAAGNLVVVATWVVSRTVGLPLGDYAGITLPVEPGLRRGVSRLDWSAAAVAVPGSGALPHRDGGDAQTDDRVQPPAAGPGGGESQPGQHGSGLGGAQVVLGAFPGGGG